MALRPIASVLLAGLFVLPAVALVQYWRRKLHRWRLTLATSIWLLLLANAVLALTENGLAPEFALWPALAIVSALGAMVGLALTVWFWIRRDRTPDRTVAGNT